MMWPAWARRASSAPRPDLDRDALGAQALVALAGDFRIGILQRRNDARDAGLDDGVGARRRLALMRARLERDVERCALRILSWRWRSASTSACGRPPGCVQPRADDHVVLDDDRTDRRIGPGIAEPAPAEREGQAP